MKAIKFGAGLAVFVLVLGLVTGFFGLPSWAGPVQDSLRASVASSAAHPAILDVPRSRSGRPAPSPCIDVERDVRFMPAVLAGERSKMLAVGSIEAVVDFSGLTEGDVRVGSTGRNVTVTLPSRTSATW